MGIFLRRGPRSLSDRILVGPRVVRVRYALGAQWGGKVRINRLLQTKFANCDTLVNAEFSTIGVFKNIRNGSRRPRKKLISELAKYQTHEPCQRYYTRRARISTGLSHMGSDSMRLHLRNAAVDLRTNTIRGSTPGGYIDKCAVFVVTDYAKGGRIIGTRERCRWGRLGV